MPRNSLQGMDDPLAESPQLFYSRTPFIKRLPIVAAIFVSAALSVLVARHTLWLGLLMFVGLLVVSVLALRFVFQVPLDRILTYKEFDES